MFNLPNPGSNPANPFYYRTHEEQRRALEEAVTVDIEFKKDADGAAAVGSEDWTQRFGCQWQESER